MFGWHKKELYRLPSEIGGRYYPLKKLNPIIVGKQLGYRCKRDKLSMAKLKGITIGIACKKVTIISHKDLPF